MQNEENARIRHTILKAVEPFDDGLLNEKPSDDAWSAMQILDHLHKMEETITAGVAKTAKKMNAKSHEETDPSIGQPQSESRGT